MTGNLVPFVGAGVSRQAKTRSSRPSPSWTELLCELARIAEVQDCITPEEKKEVDDLMGKGSQAMAAQALKNALPDAFFEDFMRRRFGDPGVQPAPIHERLFELRPPLILTTNYDFLLETAYLNVFHEHATVWTFRDAAEVGHFLKADHRWARRPPIFKIHGTASRPDDTILTGRDYRRLRYLEHGYRTVLSAIFMTKVILMLGFSFSDPDIVSLTESLGSMGSRYSHDYVFLQKGEKGPVERRLLRDDFGLEVIEYEPTDNHCELLALVDHLVSLVPQSERFAASV
jgi:hypothetical protein